MRTLALCMLLVGCAARRAPQATTDPRLVEADELWRTRGLDGLESAARAVEAGLQDEPDRPEWLWRHARVLVERGLAEEHDRRLAIETFAVARGQAMRCLDGLPAWRQRRSEAGLDAALEVVEDSRAPCVAWGALAWARWVALLGGDAAAVDLDDVWTMAAWSKDRTEGSVEAELGQWAAALVRAVRPEALGGTPDAAREALMREVRDHPNDLVRRWDLLVHIAVPQADVSLQQRMQSEILSARASTEVDVAIRQRVKE